MAEYNDILVRCLMEEQRRDGDQRIEPAARLVDSLGDEIRREPFGKDIFVLERIMPLRKRHGARIEPTVNDFWHTMHFLAAIGAFDRDFIDVRTMQLNIIRTVITEALEFFNGTDDMLVTAFALPYRQRRAPVTVAREPPVLHMLEPVAETALADGFRDPVDCLVVGHEFVLDCRHLDEPGRERIIEQRRIAAPAMRIAVREFRCLEELALLLEIVKDHGIGLLDEDTRPSRLCRQLALAVDEIDKGDIIVAADAVIVFTKGRSHVDDARAVFRRDVIITRDDERLLAGFCLFCHSCVGKRIKRLVFLVLEILALAFAEDFTFSFHTFKYGIDQCFCQDVYRAVHAYLDVIDFRIDAECEIRRQRPRRRRPGEEIRIFALDLELDHGRTLRDVLVALSHLVRGKRRAAARAIRDNLIALIEQALIPDFLQCPPLGLDEVVFIGDVRVFHIRPETDDLGELLPHALVLPDGFAALLDERLDAVFLDLLLAVDADSLLDLDSTGRPCVSQPALRRTFLPFMDWKRGSISLMTRVSTWPICGLPFAVGGPS